MKKLEQALEKREGKDEHLKLSERLQKAKYLKRTGSPGSYKYIYKEGKGRPKKKQQELKERVAKQSVIDSIVESVGMASSPQFERILKESSPAERKKVQKLVDLGLDVYQIEGVVVEGGLDDGSVDEIIKDPEGAKDDFEEAQGDPDVGISPKKVKGKETLDWYFSKKAKRIKEMKSELQDLGWDKDELGEMRDSEIQDLHKEQMDEYKRKKDRGKGKIKSKVSAAEKKIDKEFQGKYRELVNHPDYDPDSYDAQIPAEYMGEAVSDKINLTSVDPSKWSDKQEAFMEDLEMHLVNDLGLKEEKVPPLSLIEAEMKKIDNGTYKLKSSDYSNMGEKKFLSMMTGE